jgi:mono/diheme cytochrome c family protein
MFLASLAPAHAADWATVGALFSERCTKCHSGPFAPLGVELDAFDKVMAAGVVDVAAPDASRLMQRLTGSALPRMPLDGPPFLADDQIAAVRAWIAAGAPGPAADAPPPPAVVAEDPRADGKITWPEVAGIFGRHCVECHSDNGKMGAPPERLRLATLEQVLAGGDRVVLVPGNAQASEIIRRVEGSGSPRMPFDGPPWLDASEIALLRDWIDGGALDADGHAAPLPLGGAIRMRGILTAPDAIDGARFVVTADTRVDDAPAVGARAELRAVVGADGSIVAERLRAR